MIRRKNPESDTDRKRPVLLLNGLVFALAIVLVAFEYREPEVLVNHPGSTDVIYLEEEIIPVSRIKSPAPPPPPPVTHEIVISDEVPELPELPVLPILPDLPETPEVFVIDEPVEVVSEIPLVDFAEQMPVFPGGDSAFFAFLAEEIKYPARAREAGITGRVYLSFVVDERGNVTDVQVHRGIGGGCDEEAARAISQLPQWIPGKQHGQPVKVRFTMPISFSTR
jgi:protein TonB